jgi:cold shock CspA family protein
MAKKGMVKWVQPVRRSYGWIEPQRGQDREHIYFHVTNVFDEDMMRVGDIVIYDLGPPRNPTGKPEAVNVRLNPTRKRQRAAEIFGQSIAWLNNN